MPLNVKQIKDESLAVIDAALTILNKYPELDDASVDNIDLTLSTTLNPFAYLMELFKHTSGYDVVIDILSKYIAYSLPALEIAVKGILLNKLKSIISCSVNPNISEDILRDGVVIGVDELMMTDKLNYSPLDKKVGNYFYFDTENVDVTSDLMYSTDFDAVLWYVINHAKRRITWRPVQNSKDNLEKTNNDEKHKIEQGIITLEFNEKSYDLRNAYNELYHAQVPYNNCLHVFIGDTRNYDNSDLTNYEGDLKTCEYEINQISKKYEKFEKQKAKLLKKLEEIELKYKQGDEEYTGENGEIKYQNDVSEINIKLTKLETKRLNYDVECNRKIENKKTLINKIVDIVSGNNILHYDTFETIKRNYFFNKTLVDFNINYIASLKLFDSKVIAARLLNSLTGALAIDLELSWKQQLIHEEIKKMVSMVIESDDITVSDCFFTFSNKELDAMYRKTELRKAGLLSMEGDQNGTVKVDAETILSSLNELSKTADKNVVQTVIKSALYEVSGELSEVDYDNYYKRDVEKPKMKNVVRMNILDHFMNELSYILISTLFSPKVYLLLLVNLKIMGEQPKFVLSEFIENYKNLIGEMIRAIRDSLVQYLVTELMKELGDIIEQIKNKIAIEQIQYYTKLLKHCLDCFKSGSDSIGWTMDNVDYADIIKDETTDNPKENC